MIIVCPHCLAKNRVPEEKLAEQPACGQCHEALVPLAPIELNEQNFSQFISHSDLPIFIDLWAEWCGPCKMMAPVIEQISNEETEIKVGKINIDENIEIAQKYKVMSIPMFIAFKNGEVAAKTLGAQPKEEVLKLVK